MVALVDAIAGSLPLPVLCYLLVSARLGRDPKPLGVTLLLLRLAALLESWSSSWTFRRGRSRKLFDRRVLPSWSIRRSA